MKGDRAGKSSFDVLCLRPKICACVAAVCVLILIGGCGDSGSQPDPMATYMVRTTYMQPPTTGVGPATVRGRITSADGGSVLGVMVQVMSTDGDAIVTMHAAADGSYQFSGLPAGDCLVAVFAGTTRYVSQWYGGQPVQPGEGLVSAPRLSLAPGPNEVNFRLEVGKIISGLVTWEGQESVNIWIGAFDQNGNQVSGAPIKVDDRYAVIGLAPGVYTVKALRDASTEHPIALAERVVDITERDVLNADLAVGQAGGDR